MFSHLQLEGEMFTVLTRQPCEQAGQYHSAGSEYDFVTSPKNPSFNPQAVSSNVPSNDSLTSLVGDLVVTGLSPHA